MPLIHPITVFRSSSEILLPLSIAVKPFSTPLFEKILKGFQTFRGNIWEPGGISFLLVIK